MHLEEIDLGQYGAFTSKFGGFRIDKCSLEESWSYIYSTKKLLLKLDQRGIDYVQFVPPSGTLFLKRERFQKYPSFLVWIKKDDGRAFSNFGRPAVNCGLGDPDEFHCEYSVEKAIYTSLRSGISCSTEFQTPMDEAIVIASVAITNTSSETQELEILPAVRPHMAAYTLAPWDVPSLYQKVSYSNQNDEHVFLVELRSPAGLPEKREYGFMFTDLESPEYVEVSYDSFVGKGTFDYPEALFENKMSIDARVKHKYADYTTNNSIDGAQAIIALRKRLVLKSAESFKFTIVFGSTDNIEGKDRVPDIAEIRGFRKYFGDESKAKAASDYANDFEAIYSKMSIQTPDAMFSRYVNEFLPLQLKWVIQLDRGWPTGMRGTRDSAQDATALVPLAPKLCRDRLHEIFACQRSDGWFPRQYSIQGAKGIHDLRNYVDGGVWVWEFLYDYLCWSKDFALLQDRLAYLDSDVSKTLIDHIVDLIGYYINESNMGEHGLCLIREGDWNDSINRAGLLGRGESVMVSCQVVMMLKQAAYVFGWLSGRFKEYENYAGLVEVYNKAACKLKENLLENALNEDGYLNAVFTDAGEWVFSPNDPDGRKRISVPVNAFGIISGVVKADNQQRVIDILKQIKQQDGWPLFFPGIGDRPIINLGRIGTGDLRIGLGENGTPYNHGCHGFLGRAAAVAGDGDMLVDILAYMLPYDQKRHPVERTKSAPYGVVNHWKSAPGFEGRGGDLFLSGSISTAFRNVYGGLFGIEPKLDCLSIHPCFPTDWDEASVKLVYISSNVVVHFKKADVQCQEKLIFNDVDITAVAKDGNQGTHSFCIPDSMFQPETESIITVHFGAALVMHAAPT
ncbi:MAG: GH36-type glycosyl hydrolase domain-containing protein [Armatimonadota bacterium]